MLPEHTNKLYTKEAISSISLTRDVGDKINEIIDALNKISDDDLIWKHEQEGRIEKGVLFMKDNLINSIYDLLKLYLDTEQVDMILVNLINNTIRELTAKSQFITPEMYGAVGDGNVDDTQAFLEMIKDVESQLPMRNFGDEEPAKDYTNVSFIFAGKYKISKPITFDTTYGLTINGLNLIASDLFTGEGMLVFNHITRNLKVSNLTVNGNLVANACVVVHDYTLTNDFNNVEITHFKKYGFYADGKGHEIKVSNMRINQYEWGELDHLDSSKNGTGLFLGEERHDNNFTNLIVNYCNKCGIDLRGGANTFVNSHLYSCEILNTGRYNKFNACYFDNAKFKTYGFFNLTDCLLLRSGSDVTPLIYFLVDSDSNAWMYDTCNLIGNTFKSEEHISKPIDLGGLSELPKFNTIGNTFYYVTPFTSVGRLGHTRNPWDVERESFGDETSGYKRYGNLVYIWGYITGNGFCTYPNSLELTETLHIGFERQDNKNPNLIPWANTIRPNQFWVNSVGDGSTVKWFVIGIVK